MNRLSYASVLRFVCPIFLLQAFWLTFGVNREAYWRLVMPEHLQSGIQYLEWLQFTAYIAAAFIGVLCIRSAQPKTSNLEKLFLVVFVFGAFFLSLEEVSYGQRVFNFKVPDPISRNNLQKELNLHNTIYIQPLVHMSYILVGLICGVGWVANSLVQRYTQMRFSLPEWSLSTYFLPVAIYYTWVEVMRVPRAWAHQELFEFILAIGVFMFAIDVYHRLRGTKS